MPNWFGDALFATPFLRSLKSTRPQARISVLGAGRIREVLAMNPDVEGFIPFEERGADGTIRGRIRMIAQLRDRRFEAACILRKSLSRNLLVFFAGIPRRIGFADLKSGWLLTDRIAVPGPIHRAATYLRLLEALGEPTPGLDRHRASAPPPRYRYFVSQAERRQAQGLLREHGLAEGRSFVVLHPGANWDHKRWPAERFAALAGRLSTGTGSLIVITGTRQDESLIQTIRERTSAPVVVLVGKTTLRQAAACVERASLMISNDTGLLHVACAMERPVVALYGPTSPALTGPLGRPDRTMVIHHPDCCPQVPCYQPQHPGHPGMASISVEEVHEAVIKLLQQTADSTQHTEGSI